MKALPTSLLASLVAVIVMPAASAANSSPRQIEGNPALVRMATPKKHTCKFCAVPANAAYLRSPRAIEENPELARAATCAVEVPVKARGLVTEGTPTWPRFLETR